VNYAPSGRYVGPVMRVKTNIVHLMADAMDRSEGFVNPIRAEVLIIWVKARLGDHGDYGYDCQVIQ